MNRRTLAILGIIVLIAGIVAFSALFTVHQTQQALVLQFGEPKHVVKDSGLHAKLPFIQNVVFLDKRMLSYDGIGEEVIASDRKRLVVDSFLRYRIDDPLRFYQTVGNERVARQRLHALLTSSLRQVIGTVPLQSVLTGERAELMSQIAQRVNAEAEDLGISVADVRIRRADLPEANNQAIYARMKTEREREGARVPGPGRRDIPTHPLAGGPRKDGPVGRGAEAGADPAGRRRRATPSGYSPRPSAPTSTSSPSTGPCRPTGVPGRRGHDHGALARLRLLPVLRQHVGRR